jgi:uncharacterized protein with HEPN domain
MFRAVRLALEFVGDKDFAALQKDLQLQSSVLFQLLVLGEAVKRLSEEFRSQYPEVPWKRIAGLRDRIIHRYDQLNLEAIWETIRHDLPQLLAFLERVAPRE